MKHPPMTIYEKSQQLLSLLPRKDPRSFAIFIEALVETGQQQLALLLDSDLTLDIQERKQSKQKKQKEGNVPTNYIMFFETLFFHHWFS